MTQPAVIYEDSDTGNGTDLVVPIVANDGALHVVICAMDTTLSSVTWTLPGNFEQVQKGGGSLSDSHFIVAVDRSGPATGNQTFVANTSNYNAWIYLQLRGADILDDYTKVDASLVVLNSQLYATSNAFDFAPQILALMTVTADGTDVQTNTYTFSTNGSTYTAADDYISNKTPSSETSQTGIAFGAAWTTSHWTSSGSTAYARFQGALADGNAIGTIGFYYHWNHEMNGVTNAKRGAVNGVAADDMGGTNGVE